MGTNSAASNAAWDNLHWSNDKTIFLHLNAGQKIITSHTPPKSGHWSENTFNNIKHLFSTNTWARKKVREFEKGSAWDYYKVHNYTLNLTVDE